MTLITNLAITNYKSKGMINLLALWNDMISPWPDGIFSHSVHALFCHPIAEWLATLECIWYKIDTVHWLNIISTETSPLVIEEYIPKGLLPEALFPLNPKEVHRVVSYWAHGVYPKDYVQPWVMTKEVSTGQGYHTLMTEEFHYICQHVVDTPSLLGNVIRPPPTSPLMLSLPILRSSSHNHLPPPNDQTTLTPPLSSLNLPVPIAFQHLVLAE